MQVSRVGQMLDPIVDRTWIAATLLGLGLREVIPWWLVAVLVARDVCMFLLVPLLRTRGYTSLPVHFLGKVATFFLLYAFPAVLSVTAAGLARWCSRSSGWAFVIWGSALYWWAGLLYVRQAITIVNGTRQSEKQPLKRIAWSEGTASARSLEHGPPAPDPGVGGRPRLRRRRQARHQEPVAAAAGGRGARPGDGRRRTGLVHVQGVFRHRLRTRPAHQPDPRRGQDQRRPACPAGALEQQITDLQKKQADTTTQAQLDAQGAVSGGSACHRTRGW
jgi:phosphatidylglycerophosphate synthase